MKSSHEVWSAPGPDNVRLGCHMLCVITFPHQTPAAVTPCGPIFPFAPDEALSACSSLFSLRKSPHPRGGMPRM